MRTLVLADIHGNLPAFQAVLAAAGRWDRVLFLGDVASFGPHPGPCADLLRSLDPICVMGNHDLLVAEPEAKRGGFDAWTRTQMTPEQLRWLASFPHTARPEQGVVAVHSADDGRDDLLPGVPPERLKDAFAPVTDGNTRMVLFGHYHHGVDAEADGVAYHCVRAVGQPRDGDVRAGYAILEDGVLRQYRVEYDLAGLLRDTEEKIDCLKEPFRQTWLDMVRSGRSEAIFGREEALMRRYRENTKKVRAAGDI